MLLDERSAHKYVNGKYFPYLLGGILCGITLVLNFILYLTGDSHLMVSMAGIEILLYMLLNCVGGLIVTNVKSYFKKTTLVFLCNLILVFGLIWMLLGSGISVYREYSPILEAFIFSFFGSFVLVVVIRGLISFLKD